MTNSSLLQSLVSVMARCSARLPSYPHGIDDLLEVMRQMEVSSETALLSGLSSVVEAVTEAVLVIDPAWVGLTTMSTVAVPTTFILIHTEVGVVGSVAAEVAGIKGVASAEGLTGPYDVIARAEARNLDELGKLVVRRVQAVPGVIRTLTCPVVHL